MVEEDKEALMNRTIDKKAAQGMQEGSLQGDNSILEQASPDKDNYSEDMNCILVQRVEQQEAQEEDEVEEDKRNLDRAAVAVEEVVLMVAVVVVEEEQQAVVIAVHTDNVVGTDTFFSMMSRFTFSTDIRYFKTLLDQSPINQRNTGYASLFK